MEGDPEFLRHISFLVRKKREWKIQLLLEFLVLLNRVLADSDYLNGRLERLEQFILFFETQTSPFACRGTALGEFDHVTWVTMTDQGPRMANILVDGILPDDVATESHQVFWRSLLFEEYFERGTSLNGKTLTLPLRNSFDFEIKGKLSWKLAPNSNWAIKPAVTEVVLQPEGEKTLRFTIYRAKPGKKLSKAPLPKLDIHFKDEGRKLDLDMLLEIPLER